MTFPLSTSNYYNNNNNDYNYSLKDNRFISLKRISHFISEPFNLELDENEQALFVSSCHNESVVY